MFSIRADVSTAKIDRRASTLRAPAVAWCRISSTNRRHRLFAGHKVGGVVSSNRHIFTAVDEGNIWVWDKKHLEVERKLLGPRAVNTETVWVRSLEVLPVVNPKTGKTSLKL